MSQDSRSIDAIKRLVESKEEKKEFMKAIKNPDSIMAKKVLEKYIKHLRFADKDVSYGPLDMSKLKSYVLETCKCHGTCSAMLTLAFSKADNTRGICASFATVSNELFPSKFDENCGFGSSVCEYMIKIREASFKDSTGNIPLSEELWSHTQRRKRVMDNPVSFVTCQRYIVCQM